MSAIRYSLFIAAILLSTACATTAPKNDNLYQELGGKSGIAAIVEEFLNKLADDQRIVHYFKNTNIKRFRKKLIEQFCVESGGPCQYTGDSMQQVHAGMHLKEMDFNALVEDLTDAMDKLKVPTTAQNKLLARLAPMHKDIIAH